MNRQRNSSLLPHRGRTAFVLMEVIVALSILGVAVAALMRSYAQSLAAARRMEAQTQAMFFAQQLLNEFEIFSPLEGETVGGFGDAYKEYSYVVRMEYVQPRYRRVPDDEIDQYFSWRQYHLEIKYDDGVTHPFTPLAIDSAILGFEKFSLRTKQSYAEY